jgi:phosphoadenosine phosphosulfate reductase
MGHETKRTNHRETIEKANELLADADAKEILSWAIQTFDSHRLAVASSLGAEDQVLVDIAAGIDPKVRVFTLDTGRLFPETYDLMEETVRRYGIDLEIQFPDKSDVEEMVRDAGPNLFYRSVENRKRCCFVRKVKPLRRMLEGLDAWICGLRREQSVTRTGVEALQWDEANGLVKINPLSNWSEAEVWDYIRRHKVPYNVLHDRGYPSIGCQPCTRAVRPGADPRSGRWWWESPEHKECGLHVEKRPSYVKIKAVELH